MTLLADPLSHLVAVARAGGESGQPHALFAALDTAMGAVIGHKLFTVLVYHADDHLLIRAQIDNLNHATMTLAENMMNAAVRGALKGTKI